RLFTPAWMHTRRRHELDAPCLAEEARKAGSPAARRSVGGWRRSGRAAPGRADPLLPGSPGPLARALPDRSAAPGSAHGYCHVPSLRSANPRLGVDDSDLCESVPARSHGPAAGTDPGRPAKAEPSRMVRFRRDLLPVSHRPVRRSAPALPTVQLDRAVAR